jgi:hypothetical protein
LRNNHLLVADEFHHMVMELSRDGHALWSYGRRDYPSFEAGCLANPKAACGTGEGSRLIADTHNHRVLHVSPDGLVDEIRTQDGDLCSPTFVKYLGNRNLLICDGGNRRVLQIDEHGHTVWQYGQTLGRSRSFSFPRSVQLLEQSYLVADTANNRVVEVGDGGIRNVCTRESSGLFWPRCARRLASGSYLIADARNSRIIEVSRQGKIIKELGKADLPRDIGLRDPHDVRLLKNGHLLLVDASANVVLECDWSGKIYRIVGGPDGHLTLSDPHSAQGLADGHTLICDTLNNRVIQIDEAGAVVLELEALRAGDEYLRLFRPRYVEYAPDGTIVIADSDNNRILAASLAGELLWELKHIPDSPLKSIHRPRWVHAISRNELIVSDHLNHRIIHLRHA